MTLRTTTKRFFAETKIRESTGYNAKQLQVVRQHCLNALNISSHKLLLNFKPGRSFACSRLK